MPKPLFHSAAEYIPLHASISELRKAAKSCKGCHLYKDAIQTVFGQGSLNAELMIVGEIPGEKEDIAGKPFVGPAGKFLRKILKETSLPTQKIYFTNVVKHFKYSLIVEKKIHRSPVRLEINACMPWLLEEIKIIKPKFILALGLTAAQTLINNKISIRKIRGQVFAYDAETKIMATYHPSALLRAPKPQDRALMKKQFIHDLQKAIKYV